MDPITVALIITIIIVLPVLKAGHMHADRMDAEAELAAEQAEQDEYEAHMQSWSHVKAGTIEERAFAEFVAARS